MSHTYSFGKNRDSESRILRTLDVVSFPQNVKDRALVLGMGNMIRDSIAGLNKADYKSDSDWMVAAEKVIDEKIAELKAGTLRAFVGTAVSPFQKALRAIATDAVRAKMRAEGKKLDANKDEYVKRVEAAMGNQAIIRQAEERVKRESVLDDIEV